MQPYSTLCSCFVFWLQRYLLTILKPIVCVCLCVGGYFHPGDGSFSDSRYEGGRGNQTPDRWHWSIRLTVSDWCDLWMDNQRMNYRRDLWETNCTRLPEQTQQGGSGPRGHGLPSLTELEISNCLKWIGCEQAREIHAITSSLKLTFWPVTVAPFPVATFLF